MRGSAPPRCSALLLLCLAREAAGLLTPSTASEVVDLEPAWTDPTAAFEASDTACPHHGTGLVSWSNAWVTPPVAGEDVTLPEHTKVLLTLSPLDGQTFGLITVPASSELIIGENLTDGITVDMTGMLIQGKLLVGAAGCRLSSYITLTLHGAHPGGKNTAISQVKPARRSREPLHTRAGASVSVLGPSVREPI